MSEAQERLGNLRYSKVSLRQRYSGFKQLSRGRGEVPGGEFVVTSISNRVTLVDQAVPSRVIKVDLESFCRTGIYRKGKLRFDRIDEVEG